MIPLLGFACHMQLLRIDSLALLRTSGFFNKIDIETSLAIRWRNQMSTVKEQLENYRFLKERLEYLENRLINVKAINYDSCGSVGIPKTRQDLLLEKDELIKKMDDTRKIVYSIKNPKYKYILCYRYLDCMTIEQVAEVMNYSSYHIWRMTKDALNELEKSES